MTDFPELGLPVRMAYVDDGSAKAKFARDVAELGRALDTGKRRMSASLSDLGSALDEPRRKIREFGAEVQGVLGKARSGNLFDLSGMRQSAAEAGNTLTKLRATRDAAIDLASATGDTTDATRLYVQSLRAEVIEAERAKQAADAQVSTYSRLQQAVEKAVRDNDRLAESYRSVFAEQARSENTAFRAQRSIDERVSPVLAGRRAVDNGAGYGALAELEKNAQAAEALRRALDPAIQRRSGSTPNWPERTACSRPVPSRRGSMQRPKASRGRTFRKAGRRSPEQIRRRQPGRSSTGA